MTLSWNSDTIYTATATGGSWALPTDTGSLYAYDEATDSFEKLNGGIGSISIPQNAIIEDDQSPIDVTFKFPSNSSLVEPSTGIPFDSMSIKIVYVGYKYYIPMGEQFDKKNQRESLMFKIDSLGDNVKLRNGKEHKLTQVEKDQILERIYDYVGHSYLALLPTDESRGVRVSPDNRFYKGVVPDGTIDICFLPGTEIKTPNGIKKVENISVGDIVLSYIDGNTIESEVINIRKNNIVSSLSNNGIIRIKSNALGKKIPYKDLYVTGEHCLFLKGNLIPARMLVNNNSIVEEKFLTEYLTYSIECKNHSIICADGALTETYLDTSHTLLGGRNIIKMGLKTWAKDAVAPLGTQREIVEPIWNAIMQRSGAKALPRSTTNDPNLRIMCANSRIIEPYRVTNGHYLFALPENIEYIYIMSRTSRPSEVIGPFVDDRRDLGILVDTIQLFQANRSFIIETPFHESLLTGWHKIENSHCRWTDGKALLPILRSVNSCILSIHVLQAGPYRVESHTIEATARIAKAADVKISA